MLFRSPEGTRIIKSAMVLDNAAEISEKSAATIAEQFRNVTGAEIALAVLGTTNAAHDLYGADTGTSAIAVATEKGTLPRAYTVGGTGDLAQTWIAIRALDLVRRAAMK